MTNVSMMACKKALEESGGDLQKAVVYLRKKGELKAKERSERSTGQGCIASYVHGNGKIGVIVHLACETDFVAKNEEFQSAAKDVAMHVAAMNPLYLAPEDVSHELIEKEREIWKEQLAREGKPEKILEQILQGKGKKFREESALLTQPFVKNPEITIEQMVRDLGMKMGENIKIVRFMRFSI